MTNENAAVTKRIVESNEVVFLQEFEKAILEGFYLDNTIAGYPQVNSVIKEILLTNSPSLTPVKNDELIKHIEVSDFDIFQFLVKLQSAIIAEYTISDVVSMGSLKAAKLTKKEKIVEMKMGYTDVEVVMPEVKEYSLKELKGMDYGTIKLLAQSVGTFERARNQMEKKTYAKLKDMFKPKVEEAAEILNETKE